VPDMWHQDVRQFYTPAAHQWPRRRVDQGLTGVEKPGAMHEVSRARVRFDGDRRSVAAPDKAAHFGSVTGESR